MSHSLPVDPEFLSVAARLAVPELRAKAARDLAVTCGATDLAIFVRDEEINALLSAPGFPQSIPGGKVWREFMDECVLKGEHLSQLPFGPEGDAVPALGMSVSPDMVMVLLGTHEARSETSWLRLLIPLYSAVFRAEQTAGIARTQARMAREAAVRASALANALDHARRDLDDALLEARTARSEMEALLLQLQEQASEMEATNEHLTQQTDQLELARMSAEIANRAKSDFLATMSHELRTPLNAIGGHVQLLSMGIHGPVTGEQQKSLERVERNQRHLLGLINNILNHSRIEAGHVEYDIRDVKLSEILDDLAPMIEPQLTTKGLAYEVTDIDDLPAISADREKLQQILLNLLSNSVKFTEPGGRVTVDGCVRSGAPGKVFLTVRDTGRGIPPDKLETIFDPFTQVDATHSRSAQGTGLGLAISRDLARGMGGDIRARSDMDGGSSFTLMLNVAGVRPAASAQTEMVPQ